MLWLLTKYLITAGLVVTISEVAKVSDRFGALIAALPLVSGLTLIWLYVEGQPTEKIQNHAFYTFWYVLPTLPMFLVFPWLLTKNRFCRLPHAICPSYRPSVCRIGLLG